MLYSRYCAKDDDGDNDDDNDDDDDDNDDDDNDVNDDDDDHAYDDVDDADAADAGEHEKAREDEGASGRTAPDAKAFPAESHGKPWPAGRSSLPSCSSCSSGAS